MESNSDMNTIRVSEQEEYQKALAYVETLMVKVGKPVPADIAPMEVFVQEKYGL